MRWPADNERRDRSKVSPWENDLCKAAREAASGKLDRDEDVLAAVATDYCLIVLTDRNLRTIDTSKSKILLTWPLAEVKDLRVERRSDGTWLRFETTQGEHRKESLVGEWSLFEEAVAVTQGNSGRVASARVIWKGKARYIGGHPLFIKSDNSDGQLRVTDQALEYASKDVKAVVPVSDIVDASLGKYQPDIVKRVLTPDARALADIRNILVINFNYEGTAHKAEFQITGALTLPGTADKAREVLNALSSLRRQFHQPSSQNAEQNVSSAGRLRELKQLLEEELITEADYEGKKAEILRDF